MSYNDYMANLDNYNSQVQVLTSEREMLQAELRQFMIEKKAKLKFLATSLVSSQNLFKRVER